MRNQQTIIRVIDIIKSPFAVATDDGELVVNAIKACFHQGGSVAVSFSGLQIIVGIFLLAVVGPLYEKKMLGSVSFRGLSEDDRALLDRVVENVKSYHRNPAAFDAAWQEVMEEERLEAR